jgi:uncharacterized membrane-anchored protein
MKSLLFSLFLLAVAAQLAVPLRLVWRAETALAEGEPVRFPLVPRDPHDPMRGKFVRLHYDWDSFALPEEEEESDHASRGRRLLVCAHVTVDPDGFARITGISREPPADGLWFRVAARRWSPSGPYWLDPAFDRYFVNEHEAFAAETAYLEAARAAPTGETAAEAEAEAPTAYALVRLWRGEAQLEEVFVEGRPLAEVARAARAKTTGDEAGT